MVQLAKVAPTPMRLYEVRIRPNQRPAAQRLGLPRWHTKIRPSTLPHPTVYAHNLDALYTTEKETYRTLRNQFVDDIEFISGVVYKPKPTKKAAARTKDLYETWHVIEGKN